jgi:hypothetical protein
MLAMASLEPAPEEEREDGGEADRPNAAWGLSSAMLFLGSLLTAVAIMGAMVLVSVRPVSRAEMIDPERLRQRAQVMRPQETLEVWGGMARGLDQRPDQVYAAAMARFRIWQTTVGVIAVAGIALVVAGKVLGRKKALA